MSRAFKTCTPFIIINMGAEMIYILDQRLQAQKIAYEKAIKVLSDVTQSLFTEDFINQLFDPSPLVSLNFCQQMFQKIAHCSIMKLNEVSMGKLLDLMTMGLKYYLIASSNPTEIYHVKNLTFQLFLKVTLNHFNEILLLLKHTLLVQIVEKARDKFIQVYSQCNLLDFIFIRQNLLSFLQEKMVKISVFLAEELQNNDGSLKIITAGQGAPFVEEPGTILFFNGQGEILKKSIIDIKSAKGFIKNFSISYLDPKCNYSKLGFNMQIFIYFQNLFIQAQKESNELNALSSILKGNQNEDDDEIVIDFGNPGSSAQSLNKADSLNLYSDLSVSGFQQYQANKSTNLQTKMKEYFQDDEDDDSNKKEDDLLDLMDNL